MTVRAGVRVASFFLLTLLVLSIVLIVALMYADPSQFRGQIEAFAEKRGVDLELNGDLRWEIFPSFQLRVENALATYESESSLTSANIDAFSVALKPFSALRGELVVLGAEVSGAEIAVEIFEESESGDSNNDVAFDQAADAPSKFVSDGLIENLRLSNINISFVAQSEKEQRLVIDRLVAEDITFDGGYFPLVAEFSLLTASDSESEIDASGFASIDYGSEIYAVDFEKFGLANAKGLSALEAEGFGNAQFNLAKNQWRAETVLSSENAMGLTAAFTGSVEPFSAQGDVDANVSDVPKVLSQFVSEYGNAESLPRYLALDADITLKNDQLVADGFRLRVDQISARGDVEYSYGKNKIFLADIFVSELVLDDYLGEEPSEGSVDQATRSARLRGSQRDSSGFAEMLRELSALKRADIALVVETLRLFDNDIEDVSIAVIAEGGAMEIELERATLAGGEVGAVAMGDFQKGNGFQKIAAAAVGLDLSEMSKNTSNASGLLGTLQFQFQGSLDDLDRAVLTEGLSGGGSVQVDDLAIQTVNVEQKLCEAVELVGASSSINPIWENGTYLGSLSTAYNVKNGLAELMDWDFEYGNMYVSGSGTVDLPQLEYELGFSASVNGDRTSERGCSVNKYLQGVELPMLCKGMLGSKEEMDCGLDTQVMQRLAVQQLREEAVGGVVDKLIGAGSSASSETEESGSESGESSTRRSEVESLLKGLLNKLEE